MLRIFAILALFDMLQRQLQRKLQKKKQKNGSTKNMFQQKKKKRKW